MNKDEAEQYYQEDDQGQLYQSTPISQADSSPASSQRGTQREEAGPSRQEQVEIEEIIEKQTPLGLNLVEPE